MALHLALEAVGLRDVTQVGGKAARLGEAARLGVPVPRSLILPTELYRRYMRQGGLQGEIAAILGTLQPSTWTHFRAAEWAIQNAFRIRRTPEQIVAAIVEAFQMLDAPSVAIRSSATSEDSPQLSFVGQHHTALLENADSATVVQTVLQCWMSLFSAKALSYAHHFGVDLLNTSMAVLIQEAIHPDLRGTLFTADPISGNPDLFLLELAVDSQQDSRLAGVRHIDPYDPQPGLPFPLPQLCELGLLLDEHCAQYQSIEWATAAQRLYVLRLRPMTAVPAFVPGPVDLDSAETYRLVKPIDQSARATTPHSHYHVSRHVGMGVTPQAQRWRRTRTEPSRQDICVCGYHYTRVPAGAEGNTQKGAAAALAQCLAWTKAARSLRRDITATRTLTRGSVDDLAQCKPAEMSPRELYAHLLRTTELCDSLVRQSKAQSASHANLVNTVALLQERWSSAAPGAPALVASTHAARARRDAELCQLARANYSTEQQRESAFRTFFQQHQHLYLKGDPLTDGQDISTLAPDVSSARSEFEQFSAPENIPHQDGESRAAQLWADSEHQAVAAMKPLQRVLFRRCLRIAQSYAPLALDRDEPALICLLLEHDAVRDVGRRLQAEGACEHIDDVFALRYTEVLDWLQSRVPTETLKTHIRERLREQRRWARYTPPELLPAEPTDAGQLAAPEGPAIMALSGRPICRGVVEGSAQVIESLPEAGKVLPGQVLVCREPLFELSPLFGIVSAVVSEAGGLLDPAAVLVREYGVPAIFGVVGATEQLHTGDRLLIDAYRGHVLRRRPVLE